MEFIYKYKPEDYKGILNLSEDMTNFYQSLEAYKKSETLSGQLRLRKYWQDLFFTLKHREIEGNLNPVTAHEIRDYLEELANDPL